MFAITFVQFAKAWKNRCTQKFAYFGYLRFVNGMCWKLHELFQLFLDYQNRSVVYGSCNRCRRRTRRTRNTAAWICSIFFTVLIVFGRVLCGLLQLFWSIAHRSASTAKSRGRRCAHCPNSCCLFIRVQMASCVLSSSSSLNSNSKDWNSFFDPWILKLKRR